MWVKFEDERAIKVNVTDDDPDVDDVLAAAAKRYRYREGKVGAYLPSKDGKLGELRTDQKIQDIFDQVKGSNPILIKTNQSSPDGMF